MKSTTIRTFSELDTLDNLEDRFRYLSLGGSVGEITFGSEREVNQRFYRSPQWRQVRSFVRARDLGCDLGVQEFPISGQIYVHHMNPMSAADIVHGDPSILDPEFLISVSLTTHNAIHYGDSSLLPSEYVERMPGDTKLWGKEVR